MKKIKFSLVMAMLGFGLIFLTTGCIMPLMAIQPLIAGTIVGGGIHSKYRSTKVSFIDEKSSEQDKVFLSQIKILAVWPDNETEVYLAENLQSRGISIITPSKVGRIISGRMDFEQRLDNLTQSETQEAFRIVCEESGADAIIAWKKSRVMIYSLSKSAVIWSAATKIVAAGNSSREQEMRLVAEAAANKVVELISVFGGEKMAEAKK